MPQILLRRRHSLTRDQARRAANAVAKELAGEYGVAARWIGDTLYFERASLNGRLQLESGELVIEVTLGFFLAAFRKRIADGIESKLALVLARRSVAARGVATRKRKRNGD